jgi:hypothetical protein
MFLLAIIHPPPPLVKTNLSQHLQPISDTCKQLNSHKGEAVASWLTQPLSNEVIAILVAKEMSCFVSSDAAMVPGGEMGVLRRRSKNRTVIMSSVDT